MSFCGRGPIFAWDVGFGWFVGALRTLSPRGPVGLAVRATCPLLDFSEMFGSVGLSGIAAQLTLLTMLYGVESNLEDGAPRLDKFLVLGRTVMSKPVRRPHAARRLGDDYQDIVGAQYLLEMLEHPGEIKWVTFEADDAGALDDVLVARRDRREFLQVKYAVKADQVWSIKDLTVSSRSGTAPLLKKWADGWQRVRSQETPYELAVLTNRVPDDALGRLLTRDGRISASLLQRKEFAQVRSLVVSVSGLEETDCWRFLSELQFRMGQPQLEPLREQVFRGFQRIGTTEQGWNSLLQQLRRWTRYREPTPDGLVRAGDIRVAAYLWDPFGKRLPQEFPGDPRVHVLNRPFVDRLRKWIRDERCGCLVIQGEPGSGKSSLLGELAGMYASAARRGTLDGVESIILHHCFLSTDDPTYSERTRHGEVASDLKRQLYRNYELALSQSRDDAVELLRQDLENLPAWLRVCAQDASHRSMKILLVLDGLDHVVSEHDRSEVKRLLRLIPNPIPDGLFVVIGTQPIADLLPYPLRDHVTETLAAPGFHRDGIAAYTEAYLGTSPAPDLLAALEAKSEGNPLYLRYVVEEASRLGGLTAYWLDHMPPYGGTIGAYYARLWNTLPNEARTLAGILATASFNVPADEVALLMERLGESATATSVARASVQHLMETKNGALRIYHPSFAAFANQQPHVADIRRRIITALRWWVSERGSELLRWSCSWEYAYLDGDPEPLLGGTSRAWAVDSLAQLRPPRQIERLLRLAMEAARETRDLARLVARGRLLSYVSNFTSFQEESPVTTAVRRARLHMLPLIDVAAMAFDDADPWDEESLICLAEMASVQGHTEVSRQVFQLMNRRLERSERHEKGAVTRTYKAAALAGLSPEDILRHYRRQRTNDPQEWDQHWRAYLSTAAHANRHGVLAALLSHEDLAPHELGPVLEALIDHDVAHATEADLVATITGKSRGISSPYAASYLLLAGVRPETALSFLPTTPMPDPTGVAYWVTGNENEWAHNFERIFWTGVATALSGDSRILDAYAEGFEEPTRLRVRSVLAIAEIGQQVSRWLSNVSPGNFDFQAVMSRVEELWWPISPGHDESSFRHLVKKTWFRLVHKAVLLGRRFGRRQTIPAELIQRLWTSQSCFPGILVEWLAEQGHKEMGVDAACELAAWAESQVVNWRIALEERAESFGRLAIFAAKAGLPENAERLIHRACDNILGYGYHKDMSLFSAIGTIRAVHASGHARTEEHLLSLAPLVEAMDDITDGDETSYLPHHLYDSVAEISPHWRVSYILDLAARQQWRDRDRCLAAFLAAADFSDPVFRALALTVEDSDCLDASRKSWARYVEHLEEQGDPHAADERDAYERWCKVELPPELRRSTGGKEAQSSLPADRSLENHGVVDVSGPEQLLIALQNGTIRPSWDNREQLAALVRGWYSRPGASNTEALCGLARWQLGRAHHGSEYELSDAFWQACLTQGLNDLAYPLLVDAQASGHGWSTYFTSKEKSVARQEAILQHFRGRAIEFVLDSLFSQGAPFGIWQTEVLCGFLCQAGQTELAFRICDEVVDFVRSLSADCPMPPVPWVAPPPAGRPVLELLIGRLTSPEDIVKARSAIQLSHLVGESRQPADLIGKIVADMRAHDIEWLRYPHMLALHLVAEEEPGAVTPCIPELREVWSQATILGRFLFDTLCRLSGQQGQMLGQQHERPETATVQTAPEWFTQIVDNYRVLYQLPDKDQVIRAAVLARMFAHARDLGVNQDNILSLEGPISYFSDFSQGTQCPADNTLGAILRTSYLKALAEVPRDVEPRDDSILFWALKACPFDRSMARIKVEPLPIWIPADSGSGGSLSNEVASVELPNWEQILRMPGPGGMTVLGCDLNVWRGNASEETRVYAFMYETAGGALPNADEIFHALNKTVVVSGTTDMAEFDKVGNLTLLDHIKLPLRFSHLRVFPIVGQMGLFTRRWFPIPSMFRPVVVLPAEELTELLGQGVFDSRVRYRDRTGKETGFGFYWQDGIPSRLHGVHNLSAGFVLQFDEGPLHALLGQAHLRLGWVRRTERRFTNSLGDDKPRTEIEFALHGVSVIVLP